MDEVQGSNEWFTQRLGKVTASRVADVMARTKTGYSASRDSYMTQLVLEVVTGQKADSFTSKSMEWGTAQEPFARSAYEAREGVLVEEVGFVPHPTIERAGASPDGLVGLTGLVEIKCPESNTMMETILTGKVPSKYNTQMQMQMACTGREWCDYVVFDPRFPPKAQLFAKRGNRDDKFVLEMEIETKKFLSEMMGKVTQFTNYIESQP